MEEDQEKYLPLAKEFVEFVNEAVTPFHAVEAAKNRLEKAGFVGLKEKEEWELKANGKYYFTRNQTTLSAFVLGGQFVPGNGLILAGAHTDSPNLQVKPNSQVKSEGYNQLGVQCYGGGLWTTWFDRDLSIAGRVILQSPDHKSYDGKLFRMKKPILRIPTLAVHLDRDSSSKLEINKQDHLVPILSTVAKAELDQTINHENTLKSILGKELGVEVEQIKDYEVHLYDTHPSTIGGLYDEFIFSARLDNLLMSFCSLKGLIEASNNEEQVKKEKNGMGVVLFDHEEVGSQSSQGAAGPIMNEMFKRINASPSLVERSIRKSFLVSADMAHAVHPNYPGKHEKNHKPQMHLGTVIKQNVNQRYASNAPTSFLLRELASRNNIPIQEFVVRNDVLCGSTIGPILSSSVGIRTVDIGNPQLSMHSIRETCATSDVTHAIRLLSCYFSQFTDLDESLTID